VVERLVEAFDRMQDSVCVYCNSQRVIHLAKDHKYQKRMMNIDVRYHKIRQRVVDDKVIDLVKINTKKNPDDIMMKNIPVEKFRTPLNFIKILQK